MYLEKRTKMIKYGTTVVYIDVRTGEILTKSEMKNRNFLEIKKETKIKIENGYYERTIYHYGNIGSSGDGDSQLRLL